MSTKRVHLASPTYGPVMAEVYDSTIRAVMLGSKHGIEWAGTASTEREGWESARNSPVTALRDRLDVDGIVWLDSDMVIPPYALARLVNHDKDLVSALYFQRHPPYWPNAYGWNPKTQTFHRMRDYAEDKLISIGAFGFGCCYTSMKLIRALPKDPFKFGKFSEDLGFCKQAADAGFQPHLDTGIKCDHYIGPRWANEKLFKRWKSAVLSDTAQIMAGVDGKVLEAVNG